MYLPPQFNHPEHALELIRSHPLASLISNDDEGFPFVTHLPMHVEAQGEVWQMLGHCARANPHWRYLAQRPEALLVFQGPHAFMSTRVYPDLVRVPTWSYLVVHVKVRLQLVDGEEAKDVLLKQLIADHDAPYAAQWRGLPESYTQGMLKAIVAFKGEVLDVKCKIKLNQHRSEAHERMKADYAQGTEQERALAHWMERLGL